MRRYPVPGTRVPGNLRIVSTGSRHRNRGESDLEEECASVGMAVSGDAAVQYNTPFSLANRCVWLRWKIFQYQKGLRRRCDPISFSFTAVVKLDHCRVANLSSLPPLCSAPNHPPLTSTPCSLSTAYHPSTLLFLPLILKLLLGTRSNAAKPAIQFPFLAHSRNQSFSQASKAANRSPSAALLPASNISMDRLPVCPRSYSLRVWRAILTSPSCPPIPGVSPKRRRRFQST